jgi:hypothetical protein
MSRPIAAIIALILCLAAGPAAAQSDCTPYCDFNHYYGPQDFTWVKPGGYGRQQFIYLRPGLFLHPYCDPSGYCSPYLLSSEQRFRGRVTVRTVTRPVRVRP